MSATDSIPSQSRLKELLCYDEATGIFTWKYARSNVKAGAIAGCISNNGYIVIRIDKRLYTAHRLALAFSCGESHVPKIVDHINGIKTDNRITNLRSATKTINGQNRRTAQSNNKSSGLLGVAYIEHTKKFTAYINFDGKRKYLGLFKDKDDAHEAYIDAKRSVHEGCTI